MLIFKKKRKTMRLSTYNVVRPFVMKPSSNQMNHLILPRTGDIPLTLLQPGNIPLDWRRWMKLVRQAKSAPLYLLILLCWAPLVADSIPPLFRPVIDAFRSGTIVGLLTLASTGSLLYFRAQGGAIHGEPGNPNASCSPQTTRDQ